MAYDVVLQARGKVQTALRQCLVVATLAAAAAAPAAAQPAERELLNSERIAAEFGSYGLEVLEQEDGLRISNLYSIEAGERTCRTFAIVRYPSKVDPQIASEHAAIAAGGSIGATFAERGWEVRKTHLFYSRTRPTPRLAELMRIAPSTLLAQHFYVLEVAKDGSVIEYAALIEIHHPDYLDFEDLWNIYGTPDPTGHEGLVALMSITALEDAR